MSKLALVRSWLPPATRPGSSLPSARHRHRHSALEEQDAQGGEPYLAVQGVTVRFGGVVANDGVTLTVERGTVTALIGPNGAGKSTLFDVITGARRPAAGVVVFCGEDVTDKPPHVRARMGIARTFQNLAIAKDMSVVENVYLGTARFLHYGAGAAVLHTPNVRKRDKEALQLAENSVHALGLDALCDERVGDLPYGDQRRVEIARALAMRPSLLLLDEPAAGMGIDESASMGRAVRAICETWGISVFVVEHDLDFVRSVASTTYVLDFGTVIAFGSTAEVLADARVQRAYMGKEVDDAGVA
ncbi:MAG: ABC transporter ATP-binding protein [Acidimicrobiales bacterium]